MSGGLFIALLVGFLLLAVLLFILLFWFKKDEENIKGKQVLFYTIIGILFTSGAMMLGIRPIFQEPRIGAILLLILLLALGGLHLWLINLPKTFRFSSKMLFSLGFVLVSAFVTLLVYYLISDQTASYQFLTGYTFFLVPLITYKAFDLYLNRPIKWYPTAVYHPGYNTGPIDFTKHQPMNIQLRLKSDGPKRIYSYDEFPNDDPLKWVIYSFWVDYLEEKREVKVENIEEPIEWLFFAKPFKYWPFRRILDPDESLNTNKVSRNNFLILKRRLKT